MGCTCGIGRGGGAEEGLAIRGRRVDGAGLGCSRLGRGARGDETGRGGLDGVDVGTTALAAEDMVEVEGKVRTGEGAIGADETPAEDWSHTIAEAVLVVVEADNKLLGSCEVRVGPRANVSDENRG